MLCRVIATPCAGKGDFNGWKFTQDDGRSLMPGEVRFTYNPIMRDRIKDLLRQAKRDYAIDRQEAFKQYKASKAALEYTMAMRAWAKEKNKFIHESMTLQCESL